MTNRRDEPGTPPRPVEIGTTPRYGAPADQATTAEVATQLTCERCGSVALLRIAGRCPACIAEIGTAGASPVSTAPAAWLAADPLSDNTMIFVDHPH